MTNFFDKSSPRPSNATSASRGASEQTELVLPDVPEILEQVSAPRSPVHKGTPVLTHLDIALSIVTRFETMHPHHREHEELRYLRACLCAGHDKLHTPATVTKESHLAQQLTTRRSNSNSSSRLHNANTISLDVNSLVENSLAESEGCVKEPSAPQAAPTSSAGAAAISSTKFRKDYQYRGALQRARFMQASGGSEEAAKNMQEPLARCPWMGPVVPRWPIEKLSDESSRQIDSLIAQEYNEWGFNVFALDTKTMQRSLTFAGWEALLRVSAFSEFDLIPETTSKFLLAAEALYLNDTLIPYHNRIHAADVTQSIFALITTLGFRPFLDAMDSLVCVFSAIIHDAGHDGKGNGFHVESQDELAIVYNDRSVLENYALTICFRLLYDAEQGTDMFGNLSKQQKRIIRQETIDMVLATDLSQHYVACEKFRESCAKHGKDPERWQVDEEAMYSLRAVMLHAADVSNLAKPFNLSSQWTMRCLQELFAQGDHERALGRPISPLCDRTTVDVPGSQVGFLGFIVQPTFEYLASLVLPVREVCLAYTARNAEEWSTRQKRDPDEEDDHHRLKTIPENGVAGIGELATFEGFPAQSGDVQEPYPKEQSAQRGSMVVDDVYEQEDNDSYAARCRCWSPALPSQVAVVPV